MAMHYPTFLGGGTVDPADTFLSPSLVILLSLVALSQVLPVHMRVPKLVPSVALLMAEDWGAINLP